MKTPALHGFPVVNLISITSFTLGALPHSIGWQVVNVGVIPLIGVILGAVLWLRPRRRVPASEAAV